ncbi:hypothetical protein ABC977_17395 [Thioalkalicoccus limnaeus]|uniref:Uncharacterized protein n=1 Tax=Thioalkalicoccus limnaeus TaxID=120681 RepID=A0ABV4BI33_9GAMM
MEPDDPSGQPLEPSSARRCQHRTCPACRSRQLALVLNPGSPVTPSVLAALEDGRAVIPDAPLPVPRPAWQCLECGAWVYYHAEDESAATPGEPSAHRH